MKTIDFYFIWFRRSLNISILFIALGSFWAVSSHAATVTFDPNPNSVNLGDTFTLDIIGTGFPETEGGGAEFTFDKDILQVNSVTVDGGTWEIFTSAGSIDNLAGSVDGIVVATFIDQGASFTVATIEFEAIGLGASALILAENPLNVWAAGGSPINPTFTAGSVTVTTTVVPLPASIWLFGSALGLFSWLRRKT